MKFFPKANHTKKSGFTLTEVLVVVLVISVLAAMAYPIYTKSATKSRAVEAINLLEMVRNKQLIKFARDKEYYTEVSSLGQLTTNKSQESINGQELKVNNYTVSLNSSKKCVTATYDKGNTKFSFSSGYESTGLGCTGDICSSFGNIVGGASDVCNCNGLAACGSGFTRNVNTCACECSLCIVDGACQAPTQTQETSRSCGNGGTQTRSCTASCNGGSCGEWGPCTGQSCPASSKPAESEACGNCGTRTRTVTCDNATGTWSTGSWGSCGTEGVCTPNQTQACGNGGTQICTSSCQWSSSCVETPCPATCADGFIRTSATTGNSATCCSCPSPKTIKMQSGACDPSGNCQADKMICACPNTADHTKCTSTGGTWNDTTCSCNCPDSGFHPFDSTTGCACPSGKEWRNWRYYTGNPPKQCICSNAIDENANAGGACSNSFSTSNDMEARCKGLFCTLSDYCSLSTGCRFVTASDAAISPSQKFDAERTAAGTWNPTTCSCTCPAGGTLTNGRCFMCASPLSWNGTACACQLNCAMGYGQLDNYPYNTNAVRASTGCNCVCPTGWTWDYHGVTHLGQQVQTCAPTSTCSGESTRACGNCNTGTQTRTCNTTTGQWSAWSACTGGGVCAAGTTQTQSCTGGRSGNRVLTCSSSCVWGNWDDSACLCTGPKTYWDASNNRCICENSYAYYIPETNACCYYGTPKTDTRCWGRKCTNGPYEWRETGSQQFTVSLPYSNSSNGCGLNCMTEALKVGAYAYCEVSQRPGNPCVSNSSTRPCTSTCNNMGCSTYSATFKYTTSTCMQGPEVCSDGQALWDPSIHNRW